MYIFSKTFYILITMALQINSPDQLSNMLAGKESVVVIGYLPEQKPKLPYKRWCGEFYDITFAELDCSKYEELAMCHDIFPGQALIHAYRAPIGTSRVPATIEAIEDVIHCIPSLG
ncbi:hypothetical protein BCR43DRAFT_528064 [Syncephalastrum racemosum]|uniref:Uncharacterized protein n=1 Tax=Syncephalastrum racemosum TaxID=13706 RepID=A0A1X2H022_SYNRA|nr:hypothetical protein BCR43DRAFT_528064 [Syncephalastrum racemosum]